MLRRFLEPQLDYFRNVSRHVTNTTKRIDVLAAKAHAKSIEKFLDKNETDRINSTPDVQFRLPDHWRSLSAKDATYVRDCLFPEDAMLHARLCAEN